MCCIFFDISKAFDKVWHNGLMYKLIKLKCPLYLIEWIKAFLKNRCFFVKINSHLSLLAAILASVPQGSSLSPLLFSLFINDIPKRDISNCSGSLLYADDLVSMFMYDERGNIEQIINKYLKLIEMWLKKWKLKMSATKYSFIIFHNGPTKPKELDLQLFDTKIPYDSKPVFLGVKFDERLTFKNYYDKIKTKFQDRLKIVRILSSNYWKLSSKLLLNIYSSLVRSIIDCTAFSISVTPYSRLENLQVIQNSAFRSILHLQYDTSSTDLYNYAKFHGFDKISERLHSLNERYFENSINFCNPIIIKLACEYRTGFQARNVEYKTVLCPHAELFKILILH
jgi:hypothetical protein